MNKIFIFLVLSSTIAFSNANQILVIHPDGYAYKNIDNGIKAGIDADFSIRSTTTDKEFEIFNLLNSSFPKAVVIVDPQYIQLWLTIQHKFPDIKELPSVFLSSRNDFSNIGQSNICFCNYGLQLKHYFDKAIMITGKKPENIGIIHSLKTSNIMLSYKDESSDLNVKVHTYKINETNLQRSIKAVDRKLLESRHVDLLIILNDPIIINEQNIKSTWASTIPLINVPVFVPYACLSEFNNGKNIFAIQQDFSKIGRIIAALINKAKTNDWVIPVKCFNADKTISVYYNKEIVNQSKYRSGKSVAGKNEGKNETSISSSVPNKQLLDENNKGKFVKITVSAAKIYKNLTNKMPVAGIARSGEKLEIISEDSLWYYVKSHSSAGFLSKKDAGIVSQKNNLSCSKSIKAEKILFFVILLAGVVSIIWLIIKKKNSMKMNKNGKKNCIIISKKVMQVKYSNLRKNSITLEKYLKKFDFTVRKLSSLNKATKILTSATPDMICVDCQISYSIIDDIFKLLMKSALSPDFVLIFCNNIKMDNFVEKSCFLEHTFFLGCNFTTYDLNKALFKINTKIHKDSHRTYIEGRIAEESLQEILQMIDFHKKTGYLYVENICFSGMLFFEEGIITYAITDSSKAEKAIYEILSMKNGTFRFIVNKKPVLKQLHLNVMTVLLERAKFMDEKSNCLQEPVYENYVTL